MSSTHFFDTAIAEDVGVNAAVVYECFKIWVRKNASECVNFKNGQYWIKGSISELQNKFPYFTEKQIRTAINVLFNKKYIKKGQLSLNKLDRTMWYTVRAMYEY